MRIESLTVKNFRSLKDITINCDEIVAILGRNGAGKSTLLKALEVFYNVSYQANPFDYFAKITDSEISIQVTFTDLRDDEKKEFSSYISNEKLTVTKLITTGGAKYYGTSNQLPEFVEIRKLAAVPKRKALNDLIESQKYKDLGPAVKNDAEAEQRMKDFEEKNSGLLSPFPHEHQFFGTRNVGAGKLDNFTKFVLIPAVRDATAETERRGVILQLIDILVARSIDARPDVRQLNEDFEKRVKEVYSAENLTELSSLAETITKLLSQYSPGSALDLSFDEVTPPKITLPTALASLIEDNFKSPISYSGHGLQRALVLALLQQLTLTAATPEPDAPAEDDEEKKPEEKEEHKNPDLILAIEEPELYLHPSRSRFLYEVLNELSKKPTSASDSRTQVLFATHSPYFVSLHQFDKVRLSRKVSCDDTEVLQSKITAFSLEQAAQKLASVSNKDPKSFTAQSFVAHATPVMTSAVNEGFFADVVVIVEGLTECGMLWSLQKVLQKNWDSLGIVVIPAEGKNKIDRPVVIFRGLEIPTYFIFDGDDKHQGKGNKTEASTIATNSILLKLAKEPVSSFPATKVSNDWAVFHNDLETEIKTAVGEEYFNKKRSELAEEYGYSESSSALKNPEVSAKFIEAVYQDKKQIPILESIVNNITALRT